MNRFVLLLLCVIACLLRLWQIDLRPLHNDEGVNFYFLEKISSLGYYPYSHENYHGPLYFYVTYGFTSLLGDSVLALRSSAIVSSLVLCIVPFFWLFREKRAGLGAALLLFVSPSLVFYGRYAIHETLFLLCVVLFALSLFQAAVEEKKISLLVPTLALVGMITTKETWIISFAAVGVALFFSLLGTQFQELKSKIDWSRSSWALLLSGILLVAIFTGGFRWMSGLREALLALPQWISRNEVDVGHHKPLIYYVSLIARTEPWLFVLPLLLVYGAFFRREIVSQRIVIFLSTWTLVTYLIYSFVSYKTPWLVISFTVPATLTLSVLLWKFFADSRVARHCIFACLILASICSSITYTFLLPYGKKNPYSYTHTSKGMLQFVELIEKMWEKNPQARVLIGTGHYWPLPYYLREHASLVDYRKSGKKDLPCLIRPRGIPQNTIANCRSPLYDLVVVDSKYQRDFSGWRTKYFRLSDVQEAAVFVRL